MKRQFSLVFNEFHVHSTLGLFHNRAGFIKFQPKELKVLLTLLQKPGQLVTKDDLISAVWNGTPASDSSITRCISKIKSLMRKASPGSEELIRAVYGKGYIFAGEVKSDQNFLTEECLYSLINSSPDLIAYKSANGRWLAMNDSAIMLLGIEGKDWKNKSDDELRKIIPAGSRNIYTSCVTTDSEVWNSKTTCKCLASAPSREGISRQFEITKVPVYHADGRANILVITAHDITEHLDISRKCRLSEEVLSNSNDAIVITDFSNNIVHINKSFTRVTGYSEEEVVGKNPRYLSSGKHEKSFYRSMWNQINIEGRWHGEIWDRRKNGEIYPKWLTISTVRDQQGNIVNYIGIFSDLTEQKAIEHKIEFLAYHDPLTQLPNRLLLRDRFDQAIAAASRESSKVAILFVDLDKFKQINDSLGHEAGDQFLVKAGKRLEKSVREQDTVSRLGGDEFVILLSGMKDINSTSMIAKKILGRAALPYTIGNSEVSSSSSIGISIYPDDGLDFETLLKMADTAMYHSKNCGRNTFSYFSKKLDSNSTERLQLQNAIRRAINNFEFSLHYQPQFEISSHKLAGVEALIRWHSHDDGNIPPCKFIPVAEDNGSIIQIGEWVINEACRQGREWQKNGIPEFRIAVNLSALQFKRGNIVDTVETALKDSKLAPKFLELELTESILIQDIDYVFGVVKELKKMGVLLSIDDFGTGYSSLTYLKNFPIDKLKIDKSFVHNMANDENDAAIVHSIIQLAHNLKMKVIAEGVETSNQVTMLHNEGCDEIQGFIWGKPMPPAELNGFLKTAKIS